MLHSGPSARTLRLPPSRSKHRRHAGRGQVILACGMGGPAECLEYRRRSATTATAAGPFEREFGRRGRAILPSSNNANISAKAAATCAGRRACRAAGPPDRGSCGAAAALGLGRLASGCWRHSPPAALSGKAMGSRLAAARGQGQQISFFRMNTPAGHLAIRGGPHFQSAKAGGDKPEG
jgi:hypothetical protein